MDLEKVKEIVLKVIDNTPYYLYDLSYLKDLKILQILIDKKEHIDLNELALLNEQISNELDKIDSKWEPYYLEVSSPGAEKELRSLEEIKENIDSYVHIELSNVIYEGYLLEVSDDSLIVKLNLKGRIKKQKVLLEDIKLIRLAVKI